MRLPKQQLLDKHPAKIEEVTVKLGVIPRAQRYDTAEWQDPKKFVKVIKKIESYIRSSYEYRAYMTYLKECLNMNSCFYLSHAHTERNGKYKIEIHHGPLTLFDITCAVFIRYFGPHSIKKNPNFFKVSNAVMKAHYELKVGLIPLSVTAHELIHTGDIFVPLDHYFGNYHAFLEEYDNYLPEEIKSMVKTQERLTKEWNEGSALKTPTVLTKQFTYLEIEGVQFPQMINKEEPILEAKLKRKG